MKRIRRRFGALLLALLAIGPALDAQDEGPDREGTGAVFYLPDGAPEKDVPLLVALHEYAAEAEDAAEEMRAIAERGGFALLCPRATGKGFVDADLPGVLAAVSRASARVDVGKVHLIGRRDAGLAALRFALRKPRNFRSVVAEGTDVPALRPASGADRLRLLLLKADGDRPEAGRRSVEMIRDELEVAEFRLLAGDGRVIDPRSISYAAHFISVASGRIVAGVDECVNWEAAARGLALRKQRKAAALVYLFDPSPTYRSRTELIQGEILFDPEFRAAMSGVVPILAPRGDAEEVVPGQRLGPGPAIVVLDSEGKSRGALQKNLSTRAILVLLSRR